MPPLPTRLAATLLSIAVPCAAVAQAAQQDTSRRDSSWVDHDRAARAAYARKDYVAYRDQLLRIGALLPGHPVVAYKLAGAEALLGHADESLRRLWVYAATGLSIDAAADSDFASLRGGDGFRAVVARLEGNRRPVSRGTVAFTIPDERLHPEDMTHDPATGAFYVSSMKRRKIVRIDRNGAISDFVREADGGIWSVLAVAVDRRRNLLWATTTPLAPMGGFAPADSARGAVLAYDLATGRLRARHDVPPPASGVQELGELAVGAQGDVYVSDGRRGILYVLRNGATAVEPLIADGALASPQGLAVRPDGRLFVADYVRGVAIVDPVARRVEWLAHADDVALTGIDGLTLDGRRLIVVQNGTNPRRVVALTLDERLARVTGAEVLEAGTPVLGEPTHGAVADGAFYVIANSGWSAIATDGTVKPGAVVPAPLILRLPLRPDR